MMVIDNAFELGKTVYLTTDNDQKKRIVTEILISLNGLVYQLSCGVEVSEHYECEISTEINVLAKTDG